MTNVVKPIPEGYHTATPYLIVTGAAEAINFQDGIRSRGDDAYGATRWEDRARRD